jgi:hypothetical protein
LPILPPGRRSPLQQAILLSSSLAVFLGVFYATRTSDWRRVVLFLGIALASGLLGPFVARRMR